MTFLAPALANAEYRPSYIPVAVFAGGTAGVGHAMAEALARYTSGRIHIIPIDQNEAAATRILAGLTKPTGEDSSACKREFVKCDATEMKSPRDLYYSRFVYIKELVPLLTAAADLGQDARVMTVMGGSLGRSINTSDINNSQARGSTYECLRGVTASMAGIRAGTISVGYNDAMVVWFAAQHPRLAFIHIHPGMVRTPEFNKGFDFGWALKPLAWVLHSLISFFVSVSQDECTEYMVYAFLDPVHTHGMILRDRHGNFVGGRVFDSVEHIGGEERKDFVNGVEMKKYGGTGAAVRIVCGYAEDVTRAKPAAFTLKLSIWNPSQKCPGDWINPGC
ncbi:hypothetical protein C8R44DRAFT_894077 [Mycena epipterygia]|nr:hypothetical protein C8R44DRAFT_894077 [Mycena epipterygia]